MIRSIGEMGFEEANEMNVPVCIFISEPECDGCAWFLTANNYMPRKNYIAEEGYKYVADTRLELEELVRKYVVPIYEAALNRLKERGDLYYWERKS